MQRIKSYEETSHVDALRRALKVCDHLGPIDAPRIRELFALAETLDYLHFGVHPQSKRLEIVRIGRRYDDLLRQMGLGYERPVGRPRKEQAEAYVEEQGSPSALDRMMRLVANDE